jgi:CrcB protein
MARYRVSGVVLHHFPDWRFPLATFLVNVTGCLVAGVITGLVERRGMFSADARLFLFVGLLGGYTTFSAFGLETAFLLRRGEVAVAFAYAMLSVLCGVGGLWLGMVVVPHSVD